MRRVAWWRFGRTVWRVGLGGACVLGAGVALPRLWAGALPGLLDSCLSAAAALVVYALVARVSEGRWARALNPKRLCLNLASGIALGSLLSSAAVALLWMVGAYRVERITPRDAWWALLLAALPICIQSSVVEECLMRGVLLRQLARNYSRGLGLAVSAALFGAIHLANPGASWLVAAALMAQAGLLLGFSYLIGRRLWLPIGVHFAWNFMQAGVFGGALSGNTIQAIVTAHLQGADWISGGAFGIEGSLLTTSVCLAASLIIFLVMRIRGLALSERDLRL